MQCNIDTMDFEQADMQYFDADDVDIFAELGTPAPVQASVSNPLHDILLEEEKPLDVDPHLVAELLQVLAQHSILQNNNGNEMLSGLAQNIDMNSARVTLNDDEYRLSLLVELQDNQHIRPCVRANRSLGQFDFVEEQNVPSKWKPLYDLLENAFKQAIQSLKNSTYLG